MSQNSIRMPALAHRVSRILEFPTSTLKLFGTFTVKFSYIPKVLLLIMLVIKETLLYKTLFVTSIRMKELFYLTLLTELFIPMLKKLP